MAPDPTDAVTARTRRRFVRRRWARRWLAWRPVLVGALLLGAVAGATWLALFSSHLAVAEIEVEGAALLSEAEVRAATGAVTGTPLARVDLAAVEERVEQLTPVLEAEVTRGWPQALRVRVTERTPVAVVELAGSLRGMDADGVLFRRYDRAPAGLPRVVVPAGTRTEAVVEAARVVGALPDALSSRVERVEVETVDAISLRLRGGRRVVWGSADDSAAKVRVVDALLTAVPGARTYDVSVPGQPTTRS
ncbi:FtsQ-type POTRA domain-containing protein [Nocardioides perillae]|uniref:Cell division protein FtsQ n=1 Tax=Nocardioides perillae TaxID=1119534 RepID=A0A7Y9RX90_9ACTN|nr:cell division protein FtsQ [Nocardioides perillae]